jgi:hypothetical protein
MMIAQAIIYEFGQRYPEAIGRLFAVLALPQIDKRKISSTNVLERIDKEIRALSLLCLPYQTHQHLSDEVCRGLGDGDLQGAAKCRLRTFLDIIQSTYYNILYFRNS